MDVMSRRSGLSVDPLPNLHFPVITGDGSPSPATK